jgi:ubiquinone/menaquinone biosynthesis C-methylase UbiE
VSTYVYMRLLESAPCRYDAGIRLLSLGRIGTLYAAAAEATLAGVPNARVLEIGCGTGNLTSVLLERGATVTAIDCNPDMLALAREKLAPWAARLEIREMVAAEIADRFPAGSFDAAVSTLAFSEMSPDERRYVLAAVHHVVRPGGRLVIADEVRPSRLWQRCVHSIVRWPLAVITYLATQTTTWALEDPCALIEAAGFQVCREDRIALGSLAVVAAKRM